MNHNIQILSLRDYTNKTTGKIQKAERWFEKGLRALTVKEIISNPNKYIESVEANERYNIYYTASNCLEEKGRKIAYQDIVPFDIDNIDLTKKEEIARVACKAIGVEFEKTGIVFSGHGLQILVESTTRIVASEEFDRLRDHYKALCKMIETELLRNKFQGTIDPTVWSPARLLRYPNTINRKKDRVDVESYVIQANMEPQHFNVELKSGLPTVTARDHITIEQYKKYPKPDVKAVKEGCEFLKWCYTEPNQVNEPQWYAALSIVGRFENGTEEAQTLSRGHDKYSPAETEIKLEQSMKASGPRTCKNIESMWDGCKNCKYYQKNITSPIMIQGEDYIKTKDTGFYNMAPPDAEGNIKKGKPNYKDLVKYLDQQSPIISTEKGTIYKYNGHFWEHMPALRVKEFAEKNFNPDPDDKMRTEFWKKTQVYNISYHNDRLRYVDGKLNLLNGVLDLRTKVLEPHSKDFFFQSMLPYEYDPQARAPRFEQFMQEVTVGRNDIAELLLEYAGYCFSNDAPWLEKCLILQGSGENGKSKFCEALKILAGEKAATGLTIKDLRNEQTRARLDGALFNIGEESDENALIQAGDSLKSFVSGGMVTAKVVYEPTLEFQCRTKFMFTLNDFPKVNDLSNGLRRRLVVVPFDAEFTHANGLRDNFLIDKLRKEMPGILNMVVDGYQRLIARGKLPEVEVINILTHESFKLSDTIERWVEDSVEFSEQTIPKREVYDSYKKYCDYATNKPLVESIFWKQFLRRYPQLKETRPLDDGRKRKVKGLTISNDF